MTNRVPDWVTPIAWLFIALAVASAVWIAHDLRARPRQDRGGVAASLVWVTSALYLGPFAVPLYTRYGRSSAPRDQPGPVAGAVAGLPGGSASAVAHLIGVPLVIVSGLTIAGIDLWVMILVIGAIAILLLTAYERLAGASARRTGTGLRTGLGTGLGTAFVVATATVLAFDVGMGGWMLLLHYNELMPPATDASFWFLMQLGVILGLATGYPVVRRLADPVGVAARTS